MAQDGKITALLQAGLAKNISRIAYYRQVLTNPRSSFNNSYTRDLAAEVLETLVKYVLKDPQLYSRLRVDLLADNMRREALDNLKAKADKHGYPLEIIMEVYNRGLNQDCPSHLTPENVAFNRVNSFLAGADIDRDLTEMEMMSSRRMTGSPELLKNYRNDTPGQGSKTLKTIRKLIKKQ
jgi:hypothetical protein